LRWNWDLVKAELNFSKHGVRFELAERVFDDPLHLSLLDDHLGEERWLTLGQPFPDGPLLLLVVHTDPEDGTGRIISARKATKHERRIYERANR
jgi:hypothetical protein